MPSNRPMLPSFHAQHKNNRLCSKIGDMALIRVPQTALQLLQHCNNTPFVVCSVGKRTFALVLADGSSCKVLKTAILQAFRFLSFTCLFWTVEDCDASFVLFLFFQKRAFAFPTGADAPYSFFVFLKNGERSVMLYILGDTEHLFRYAIPLSQAPISQKFRSHTPHHQIPQLPLWQ